jgi:putative transposase
VVAPAERRRAVRYTIDAHGLSERRACKLVGLPRSVWQYEFRKDNSALNERMKQLATEWPRFGYRRLHVLLQREGLVVNRKRLYRLGQLALRKRLRKRGVTAPRIPRSSPMYANERWSMDIWQTNSRTANASECSTSLTTGPASAWHCLLPSR